MCERIGNAIVCGARRKRAACAECGQPSDALCDGPLPAGVVHRRTSVPGADRTCSRPICRRCVIHVPPDADFCTRPACREAAKAAAAALRSETP